MRITYICGPAASGKSTLLRLLKEEMGDSAFEVAPGTTLHAVKQLVEDNPGKTFLFDELKPNSAAELTKLLDSPFKQGWAYMVVPDGSVPAR